MLDVNNLIRLQNYQNAKEWYEQNDNVDPKALIIVVKEIKDPTTGAIMTNEIDVLNAVAIGLSKILIEDRYAEQVASWMEGRIRKIVKRARGSKWNKALKMVTESNGVAVQHKSAEVILFAPIPVSTMSKEIKQLQVTRLSLQQTEPTHTHNALNILMNPNVDMSSGKIIAQCGHAIQLFMMRNTIENVQQWADHGFAINLDRNSSLYASLGESINTNIVRIVDAGFTEVEPNTQTCLAYFSE